MDGALFKKALWLPIMVLWLLYHLQNCSATSYQSTFPSVFLFGTASSSYQYEGGYLDDGKGPSNWDVFTHLPGRIDDGSNADVTVDQYHCYLEDVDLMEDVKINSYRFSISWARILPKGRFGEVNWAGINFYNNLINALLLKGIQPFVTVSHFDYPQELEDRYGGWLSPQVQEDFQYFAEVCFRSFGDRVKYWVTFNEPNLWVPLSYRIGKYPPSRCSVPFGNCSEGDSEKEPFVAAHNIILSHAAAVHVYKTKYQKEQGGQIGFVLHCDWFEPFSNSTADKLVVERALSFTINWFLDPILYGKYPEEMVKELGTTLPRFSQKDRENVKNGLDFIGINHYASYYVQDCISSLCKPGEGGSRSEGSYSRTAQKNGVPMGELTQFEWLNVYPQGMEKMITYFKDKYNNTPIIITENGYGELEDPSKTREEYLNDVTRIKYMDGHLNNVLAAIRKGADVRGYFAWSLLDNFEWTYGLEVKFGLYHVDFATLKRTPKLSASWYKQFISKHKAHSIVQENNREKRKFKCSTKIRKLEPQPSKLSFE
ncbi:hypothetical protein QN277_005356 [Acacia crassicarpa]|uniref:Beta-glucosidase n=2 Tax=Acacia crassicarpa TaxID=499986 RepID=A0AAE1MBF6_9FABA|nr:hypothetical protein QN277_005356 [Acacia crassicarpa]